MITLNLGIAANSDKELFNCTLNDPSRTRIKLGPHIWISSAKYWPNISRHRDSVYGTNVKIDWGQAPYKSKQ